MRSAKIVYTAMWLVTVSSGIYFFSMPHADNDLWGHLFFGHEILASGRLPQTNQYSYSATSYPWINHEIGSECVMAAIYDRLGAAGLLAMKTILGLLTVAVIARTVRRRADDPLAWGTTVVLVASLMSWGYLVRPQIFTFLALAVLWDRLQAYAARAARPRALWYLPALFMLWVNTHGGVLAGTAVLVSFTALRTVELGVDRRLVAVTLTCVAALLVNPYGPSLPAFLVQDMLRDRPISEWASIPLFDLSNAHFKAAVLLAIGGLLLRRERRLWEVAIVAATAAAAFRHERHMPLFAILAAPYLGETLGLLAARLRQRIVGGAFSVGATASVSVGALAIAAVQLVSTVRIHHATHGNIFVAPEEFPVHAVRFIRENGLRGNLAVPFDWGEYAIWHLYPDCRVSIDGRYTTAYPSNVIDSGWRFIDGSPGWDALLQDASVALVDRRHGTALRLFSSPQWRLAYLDPTAIIFVRKIRDDLPVRVARAADDGSRPAIFFP